MDAAAKVTSKGQVTVPKDVRDALGIHQGDTLIFHVDGDRAFFERTPNLLRARRLGTCPRFSPSCLLGRGDQAITSISNKEIPLSFFVDTNVLIMHLVGDPPALAKRASKFLAEATELLVTDLIVAECVHVLESVYSLDRTKVATSMRSLLALDAVLVINRPLLLRSLEVYEIDGLDFAEAYLVACAEATGIGRIASFDKAISRVATVTRIEP